MILLSSCLNPQLIEVKKRLIELRTELEALSWEEKKLEHKELKPGEFWRVKGIFEPKYRLLRVHSVDRLYLVAGNDRERFCMDTIILKRSEHETEPKTQLGSTGAQLEASYLGRTSCKSPDLQPRPIPPAAGESTP